MGDEQDDHAHGFMVYTQTDGVTNSDDNIWDDTALIKAYDKAVQQVHKTNEGLKPFKSKKKKNKSKKSKGAVDAGTTTVKTNPKQWLVGDSCCARYSEDGVVYPAIITDILSDGQCIVQYIDYGNEEEQKMSDLIPSRASYRREHPNAMGLSQSRTPSVSISECSSSHSHAQNPGRAFLHNPMQQSIPSFVPPPPPSLPEMPSGDADEAFHSMLISWYMSGYHTGYYQGLKDAKIT